MSPALVNFERACRVGLPDKMSELIDKSQKLSHRKSAIALVGQINLILSDGQNG